MEKKKEVVFNKLMASCVDHSIAFYTKNMGNKDHLDRAEGINMAMNCINMAELYLGMGYHSQALDSFQNAVFIGRLVEPYSLVVATAYYNMGDIYQQQGKLDEALECYQETLLIEDRLVPYSRAVQISYNAISNILALQGKPEEAATAAEMARKFGFGAS